MKRESTINERWDHLFRSVSILFQIATVVLRRCNSLGKKGAISNNMKIGPLNKEKW